MQQGPSARQSALHRIQCSFRLLYRRDVLLEALYAAALGRFNSQQLIPRGRSDPDDLCSTASPYDSDPVLIPSGAFPPEDDRPLPPANSRTLPGGGSLGAAMRFSTLGSDCSSSYYGLPGGVESARGPVTARRVLRANLRVVLGSTALAFLGAVLLGFGICVMLFPNDMDVHGWIFLVVGVLFAIPGFYHVWYIGCTLCGRSGYSFENLPTFTKPNLPY
uniref:Transmembrane protein 230 n=1 Tax=Globodera pallida TaxID=36090 RepID=A0A183BNL3_GLOPA